MKIKYKALFNILNLVYKVCLNTSKYTSEQYLIIGTTQEHDILGERWTAIKSES